MLVTENRTKIILSKLACDPNYCSACDHYGEPGYTDPEKSILFCNWNDIKQVTQDYLEKAGFELEWEDEWTIDCNHNKAYRTEPTHWWWKPSSIYGASGERVTIHDEPHEIIEQLALDNQISTSDFIPGNFPVTDEQLKENEYVFIAEIDLQDRGGITLDHIEKEYGEEVSNIVFRQCESHDENLLIYGIIEK